MFEKLIGYKCVFKVANNDLLCAHKKIVGIKVIILDEINKICSI